MKSASSAISTKAPMMSIPASANLSRTRSRMVWRNGPRADVFLLFVHASSASWPAAVLASSIVTATTLLDYA
jgi:hypothetical protein